MFDVFVACVVIVFVLLSVFVVVWLSLVSAFLMSDVFCGLPLLYYFCTCSFVLLVIAWFCLLCCCLFVFLCMCLCHVVCMCLCLCPVYVLYGALVLFDCVAFMCDSLCLLVFCW